ncbi:MAG: hypothetical protein IT452_17225 [Planctomycetia bacterium]|nr:hypothetical protein [Planctomycetia bacterium]
MDPTREFDKALKQIEKRIEELESLAHGLRIDLDSPIQALRARLEALRRTAHPAAASR